MAIGEEGRRIKRESELRQQKIRQGGWGERGMIIRVRVRVEQEWVAAMRGDWGGEEGDPAEWAGGSGGEPGVDAGGVEGVGAGREEAELVITLELGQADGAIRSFFEPRHDGLEGEDRQLLYGRPLQP